MNMKKLILLFITFSVFCALFSAQEVLETDEQTNQSSEINNSEDPAQEKPFQNHVLSALGFQAIQTAEKDFIFTPSVNLQYMRIKSEGVESKQPDAIVIGAGYSQNIFTAPLGKDKVQNIHGVNLMGNLAIGKNSFMAMVASSGEVPFSNIRTVTGMVMYTRQLLDTENFSFLLGGGIVVADLGLKIGDFELFVIPLPVFNFSYTNDYFYGAISMMGLPEISIVLLPKSMYRLNGKLGMAGFSSVRDITFDCALAYYPLYNSENEGIKELLCISAGIMNQASAFKLKDNKSYGYQCYSVYGEVNASFVSVRCGYNFDGKMLVDNEIKKDMYKGMFATVQGMMMF